MKETVYGGRAANMYAALLFGLVIMTLGGVMLYGTLTGEHAKQGALALSGGFCLVGLFVAIIGVLTGTQTRLSFDQQGFKFQTLGTPELLFLWEQLRDITITERAAGRGSIRYIVTVNLLDENAYVRSAPDAMRSWAERQLRRYGGITFDVSNVAIDQDTLELEFRMRSPNPNKGAVPTLVGPRIIVFATPHI